MISTIAEILVDNKLLTSGKNDKRVLADFKWISQTLKTRGFATN